MKYLVVLYMQTKENAIFFTHLFVFWYNICLKCLFYFYIRLQQFYKISSL